MPLWINIYLIQFFFLSPRSSDFLRSHSGPVRTDGVQHFHHKACFSGVYYSAVKMRSRQKVGIKSHLRGNWWGFKKIFFFFFLQTVLERATTTTNQEFTVGNYEVSPPWVFLFSLVYSVLILFSSNQILGGKVIKAITSDIH